MKKVVAIVVIALSAIWYCSLASAGPNMAPSGRMVVAEKPSPSTVSLVAGGKASAIVVAADEHSPGVIAAGLLADDIERVTGVKPQRVWSADDIHGDAVIVGTLGRSAIIDRLVGEKKIDVDALRGRWETYLIQVVDRPTKNIRRALVVVGSDRRGTAYGALTVSRAIGVSPWYWWADVPVKHRNALYLEKGAFSDGPPLVKYRGIFLNDEAPALTGWAKEKFGGLNSKMYVHVFELMLRLKANYLWPAMWGNAFNEDDPQNPKLANDYGIVMGTSHQEPMLRAQREFDSRYPAKDWNYATSPDLLKAFWREGIRRNKAYESIVTVGLRGRNDTEMLHDATLVESMALTERIVADQRKILAEELNPDVTRVPQIWCLYKEVQSYYEHGLRVPDDVTLLWSDDNWGNIRRLPTKAERMRSGGAGIYYHFDYVGGPRSYKWINTNPLGKVWQQLDLAYAYGADRVWIVNVGDLKPMEIPIDFFMTMAWNPPAMTAERERAFSREWAAANFGPAHAVEIAALIDWYAHMNGRRKPELLNTPPDGVYSLLHYREADRVLEDSTRAVTAAEALARKIPSDMRDAYFQLVLHPVKATAIVNRLYILAAKNRLYAAQGRAAANRVADEVRQLFAADAALSREYHGLSGGKWNHMMDQVHLGYTSWNDPARDVIPPLSSVSLQPSPSLGIAVEDSLAGDTGHLSLKPFNSLSRQSRRIDIFNKGSGGLTWTAKASQPWIRLDVSKDETGDGAVGVSVDWNMLRQSGRGSIVISGPDGQAAVVDVAADILPIEPPGDIGAYVESDGVVSIDAVHYAVKLDRADAGWRAIDGYGRTDAAMTVFPVTAVSAEVGSALNRLPSLRYRAFLLKSGPISVNLYVSPSLNALPGRGLRYAIAIDDDAPQIYDVLSDLSGKALSESVSANVRVSRSHHVLTQPGYHTVKIWMVDTGLVIQKIVIDAGGLQESYLGPPESPYLKGRVR